MSNVIKCSRFVHESLDELGQLLQVRSFGVVQSQKYVTQARSGSSQNKFLKCVCLKKTL